MGYGQSLTRAARLLMPIYTYQCDNCGVRFERQQSFSEQPLTRCPECMKKTLRKVFTPVGIVFKGSGFYSTDHRSPSGNTNRSNGKSENAEKTTSIEPSEKSEKKEIPKKETE
jgi:putative FmdB family regulatory protein